MHIRSLDYFDKVGLVTSGLSIFISSIFLLMSFSYLTENYLVILGLVSISLVLNNYYLTITTPEIFKKINDDPWKFILEQRPILGPIAVLLSFLLIGTLISGNLFAWQIYIIYFIMLMLMNHTYSKKYKLRD